MTDIDKIIAELEELDKAATPGPWSNPHKKGIWSGHDFVGSCHWNEEDDSNLIVAMRNALPELLERIKYTDGFEKELEYLQNARNDALARAEKAEAERDAAMTSCRHATDLSRVMYDVALLAWRGEIPSPLPGHKRMTEEETEAMFEHLNCPLCGGSGHVDDADTAIVERIKTLEADRDAFYAAGVKASEERNDAIARAEQAEAAGRLLADMWAEKTCLANVFPQVICPETSCTDCWLDWPRRKPSAKGGM